MNSHDRHTTLLAEWHPRNTKLLTDYTKGSHVNAWWKCSICGHEWQATICNRVGRGSNCPQCQKLANRGAGNSKWSGYGDIGGRQWWCIVREAARRNLSLTVTIEEAWELFLSQGRRCRFTGDVLEMNGKRNGKYSGTASLDRIDSRKGYDLGNLQWIDKRLQHIKRNLSDEAFIAMCEAVARHQATQKTTYLMPPSFENWAKKATEQD